MRLSCGERRITALDDQCIGRCRLTDSGAFFQASLSHLSVSSPLLSLSSSFGTVISASFFDKKVDRIEQVKSALNVSLGCGWGNRRD
jgi:hypothetical protein